MADGSKVVQSFPTCAIVPAHSQHEVFVLQLEVCFMPPSYVSQTTDKGENHHGNQDNKALKKWELFFFFNHPSSFIILVIVY